MLVSSLLSVHLFVHLSFFSRYGMLIVPHWRPANKQSPLFCLLHVTKTRKFLDALSIEALIRTMPLLSLWLKQRKYCPRIELRVVTIAGHVSVYVALFFSSLPHKHASQASLPMKGGVATPVSALGRPYFEALQRCAPDIIFRIVGEKE